MAGTIVRNSGVFEGADLGFVGPSYTAPMTLQDAETCINYFVEIAREENVKMPKALLGAPGLNTIISTQTMAPVRGAWVLPGGQQCLIVIGAVVYLAKITVQATQTNIAQFSVIAVGSLATSSGRVVIRDNGVQFNGQGGFAVLVDGPNGYLYSLNGTGFGNTFTAGTTNGSPVLTLPGPLPPGLAITAQMTLTDSGGALPTGVGNVPQIASINYSTPSITMTKNAIATVASDSITLTFAKVDRITDPGFLGADRVAFIEGWLIFNQPGTRTFYTTGPTPYTVTFPGSFSNLKDSSTDNIVTLFENNREAWLIGERTSEVWFNSGGANFSFSRLPGIGPQYGCAAKHSIARVGPDLAWLGANEQGQNIVLMTEQYQVRRISNHAVENAISSYPYVADALGDCYEDRGHVMYVLTFPTANVTWVFDISTGYWWQRLSWNAANGTYGRHLGNVFVNFANVRMWGDFQNGNIYQQDRTFYTDAGAVLRASRRTPHVWSRENRKRVFQSSLQVEFTPGVGLQTGQGSNPQAMIRWSNDGGFTWESEVEVPIGKVGDTKNRAIIYQLGEARDRVYEVSMSDPVPRDIIGATLFGEAEAPS